MQSSLQKSLPHNQTNKLKHAKSRNEVSIQTSCFRLFEEVLLAFFVSLQAHCPSKNTFKAQEFGEIYLFIKTGNF